MHNKSTDQPRTASLSHGLAVSKTTNTYVAKLLLFYAPKFTNPSCLHGPKAAPTGDQARADYLREICTFLAIIRATFRFLVNLRGL